MKNEEFEKWLRSLLKGNLENLVGLASTLGHSEKYRMAYKISDYLTDSIIQKFKELNLNT